MRGIVTHFRYRWSAAWLRPLLVIFSTIVSFLTPAEANTYVDNPYHVIDRRVHAEFNAIGKVETLRSVRDELGRLGTGVGTAFLVSPCYIMTDNHVVFGEESPSQPRSERERASVGKAYAMKFSVGVGKTLEFEGSVTAIPVAWGDRDGANRNDWALLKLSSCVGKRAEIGWLELDVNTNFFHNSKKIALLSYPLRQTDMVIGYGWTTGYECDNWDIAHSASAAPGSSGGPVFVDKDGKMLVVGLHQRGMRVPWEQTNFLFDSYSAQPYKFNGRQVDWGNNNEFIPVSDIIEAQNVLDLLRADILAWGQGNPNHQNLSHPLPGLTEANPPFYDDQKFFSSTPSCQRH